MVGAAAEISQPRGIQGIVDAPALAGIKILGIGIEVEAAAFDQRDGTAGPDEGARQRDAGGAGTDDGDIRLDDRVAGNGAPVQKHEIHARDRPAKNRPTDVRPRLRVSSSVTDG